MRILFILIFLMMACQSEEPILTERIGLDPAVRGVWMIMAISGPGGENVEVQNPPVEFARAFANRILLSNGKSVNINDVYITETRDIVGNVANLENGVTLIIINTNVKGDFLVILLDEDNEEQSRMTIRVQ